MEESEDRHHGRSDADYFWVGGEGAGEQVASEGKEGGVDQADEEENEYVSTGCDASCGESTGYFQVSSSHHKTPCRVRSLGVLLTADQIPQTSGDSNASAEWDVVDHNGRGYDNTLGGEVLCGKVGCGESC